MADLRAFIKAALVGTTTVAAGVLCQRFGADPTLSAGTSAGVGFAASLLGTRASTDLAKVVAAIAADTSERAPINHDLAKLFIESVSLALRREANSRQGELPKDLVDKMRDLADELPTRWFAAVVSNSTQHSPQFNEEKFVNLYRFGHATGEATPPVGEVDEWRDLLLEYGPWKKGRQLSDEEATLVAGLLRSSFAAAARDQVRTDFTTQGRAYPALTVRLLSDLAKTQERILTAIRGDTSALRAEFRDGMAMIVRLHARAEAIQEAVDDVSARAELLAGVHAIASIEQGLWERLDATIGAIKEDGDRTREALNSAKRDIIAEVLRQAGAVTAKAKSPGRRNKRPRRIELTEAAIIIARYGKDKREKVSAAVAAKRFAEADEGLAQLKSAPEYQHVVEIKLLEGRRWDEADDLPRAAAEFELALQLDDSRADSAVWLADALLDIRDSKPFARLDRVIALYHRALEVYTREAAPKDWAKIQHNLAVAWADYPDGDRRASLDNAIASLNRALEVYTHETSPRDWARIQYNLGSAWADYPDTDRRTSLDKAIACYHCALEVYTRDDGPIDWARTQNNLGNAWADYPDTDRSTSLDKAIACYHCALEVDTREAAPMDWARTQYNLGKAWARYPAEDRRTSLDKAIACYQCALEVYTREATPMDWAATQNNLGKAWGVYPDDNRRTSLDKAIACYHYALEACTREAAPRDWAMTQNNLGDAWAEYPDEDRRASLDKAIACYHCALEVFTREAAPRDWAATQHNLGVAWADYPDRDRRTSLAKAIACYHCALEVYTREAAPKDWAKIQHNLAVAWADYLDGDRRASLHKAIACYKQALEVYTREATPRDWAMTQNNLGNAWAEYPDEDRRASLDKAIACYKQALEVYTRDAGPIDWARTQSNLGDAWVDYPDGDRRTSLDKAIACYHCALEVFTREAAPRDWQAVSENMRRAVDTRNII